MSKEIFDDALQSALGLFRNLGFVLIEPDDHYLFLLRNNNRVAVFSQTGATADSIQSECATHLSRQTAPGKATAVSSSKL